MVEAISVLRGLSKQILPQINVIESRVAYLLPKLKQITSKELDQHLEVDKKTNKLYEALLRAREESNLLPHILQRMTILEIFRLKGSILAFLNYEIYSHYLMVK